MASNFCFSYRAVLAKQLYVLFPAHMDELTLFARIASTGCLLLLPLTLLWEGKGIHAFLLSGGTESGSRDSEEGLSVSSLLLLLIGNGAAYYLYNVLSFFVLNRTNILVHAVLNVCRRMAIIVFTALYFSVHVSGLNAAGVVLALCGVLLFSLKRTYIITS